VVVRLPPVLIVILQGKASCPAILREKAPNANQPRNATLIEMKK
jgi:hypothetical protein